MKLEHFLRSVKKKLHGGAGNYAFTDELQAELDRERKSR